MEISQKSLSKKELKAIRRIKIQAYFKKQRGALNRVALYFIAITLILTGVAVTAKKLFSSSANKQSPALIANITTASDWLLGNEDAKITIVEYNDFQCEDCAKSQALLKELQEDFKNTIKIVYRHFPKALKNNTAMASQDNNAILAAKAAEAAGKQDKFWEMQGVLFENQNIWKENLSAQEIFETFAKNLNLDLEQFRKDIISDETTEKIKRDYESGIYAGVTEPLTCFIGNLKIESPKSYEELKNAVEQELKEMEEKTRP